MLSCMMVAHTHLIFLQHYYCSLSTTLFFFPFQIQEKPIIQSVVRINSIRITKQTTCKNISQLIFFGWLGPPTQLLCERIKCIFVFRAGNVSSSSSTSIVRCLLHLIFKMWLSLMHTLTPNFQSVFVYFVWFAS